ncbi:hypothetical protein MBRA1_002326 [Malassezia brasiliensis]|uniref:Glutamine amidotransferase type-2 domain-containing protein n=1 Tax=Malassezia brasiliensis TaxID=1821822 RepID=A0AAF0IT92_9BASI|nr:hypothetical protein MBRA1_002326 [Malassezia brasiliensis]
MCGIALLGGPCAAHDGVAASLVRAIARRGPDALTHTTVPLAAHTAHVAASVLGLRGAGVTRQPLHDEASHLLFAWNGEVFGGDKDPIPLAENDAAVLFSRILAHGPDWEAALVATLAHVEGPYAFLLLDTLHGNVWYGRDPLGRRSLLRTSVPGCIASVATPEAMAAGLAFEEVPCATLWRTDLVTHTPVVRHAPLATRLVVSPAVHADDDDDALDTFAALLSESVARRVSHIRSAPTQRADDAHVAVLFSGGLDCTVLAALADAHVPPAQAIDLVNVAFENPRTLAAHARETYAVPDRLTARASAAELRTRAPHRRWRLVEVDVPYATYTAHLDHIRTLLAPCTSVMDLSIAAALYFAARAEGHVDGAAYTSPARVFLSGLGADELLGGYARHRQAFRRGHWDALCAELQLDLDRLPTRNLGRDDRVISDLGREARFPYLARPVLAAVCAMPLATKADLAPGTEGTGDKRLLRRLAHRLDIESAARLPKRAIQFGARSAKLDAASARRKGSDAL